MIPKLAAVAAFVFVMAMLVSCGTPQPPGQDLWLLVK